MHAQRVVGLLPGRQQPAGVFGQGWGGVVAEVGALNIVHICKRMLAANEGQNSFGKVAGPFLAFLKDFSNRDCDDFSKKQIGLHTVFYVLVMEEFWR